MLTRWWNSFRFMFLLSEILGSTAIILLGNFQNLAVSSFGSIDGTEQVTITLWRGLRILRSGDRTWFWSLLLTAAALTPSLASVFSFILELVTNLASLMAPSLAYKCKVFCVFSEKGITKVRYDFETLCFFLGPTVWDVWVF